MRPDELPRIAHDPEAFEAFYREHVEAVQRFVVRRVADPQLAADLTAEVFLAAIDAAPAYRPGPRRSRGVAVRDRPQRRRRRAPAGRPRAAAPTRGSRARRLLDADDVAPHAGADRRRAAQARELYAALAAPARRRARGVRAARARRARARPRRRAVLGIRPVTARVRLHRARTALRTPAHRARRASDHATDGGPTMTTAQRFEDRLLDELRLVVADRPAPAAAAGPPPRRAPAPADRHRLVAAGAAAIADRGGVRQPARRAPTPSSRGPTAPSPSRSTACRTPPACSSDCAPPACPAVVDYAAGGIACVKGATPPAGGASGSVQSIRRAGTRERGHGAAAAGRRRGGGTGVPHRAGPERRPGPVGPGGLEGGAPRHDARCPSRRTAPPSRSTPAR